MEIQALAKSSPSSLASGDGSGGGPVVGSSGNSAAEHGRGGGPWAALVRSDDQSS